MEFLKKNWIMIAVALVVIIGAFMWYKKSKTEGASGSESLGKKKDGTPYTENDVQKKVKDINGTPDWKKDVQAKATKAGNSYDVQVRMEAVWMLENAN